MLYKAGTLSKKISTLLGYDVGRRRGVYVKTKNYTPRVTKGSDYFWQSTWGQMLMDRRCEDIGTRQGKLFRRRFRLPFTVFTRLCHLCDSKNFFNYCEGNEEWNTRRRIPIPLLVLGILRILGRGWCFDDVAEATRISQGTIRLSFHHFCKSMCLHEKKEWVHFSEGDELERDMNVYKAMGLPGCIGSTDCTHVPWGRTPCALKNLCKGKEQFPSLVFSVVVNHHRRIMSISKAFYGSWNDKTISRLDPSLVALHERKLHDDVRYSLYNEHGEEEIMEDPYVICDNGYLAWATMMPPYSITSREEYRLWSI